MVYNKTSLVPRLVLLKKGKRGMSLDAYRIQYPDGKFFIDATTGRPALFARNAKDWNAMQVDVYGMKGSYSIDPSQDPEVKLGESLARSIEQGAAIGGAGFSIVAAPGISAAGRVAATALEESGATSAVNQLANRAALTSVTSGGGQESIALIGRERVLDYGARQAVETLGTTAAESGASTAGRAAQAGFLTAMAASRAKTHQKLETHFERDTGETYGPRGSMRRPLVPPPEPRTVPRVTPEEAAAKVKSRSGRFIVGTRESRAPVITLSDMRASVAAEQAQTRSGARIPSLADLYRSRGQKPPGVFQGNEVVNQQDRTYLENPPIQTSTTPLP